jgi:hypothetical protein
MADSQGTPSTKRTGAQDASMSSSSSKQWFPTSKHLHSLAVISRSYCSILSSKRQEQWQAKGR